MKVKQANWTAYELVPLADRLRYMRFVRVGLVAVVTLIGGLNVGGLAPSTAPLWPATLAYIGVFAVGEGVWRLGKRRGLWLFGALVVIDGAYLVYAVHATGGIGSPLRYLLVLHLIAVALLASYRSGLKLVVWYVLLLMVEFHVRAAHVGSGWVSLPGSDYAQLVFFGAMLAGVTLGTAGLSAVNERELRRRRFDLEALATFAVELEEATEPITVAEKTVQSIVENFAIERIVLVSSDRIPHVLAAHGVAVAAGVGTTGPNSVLSQACQLRSTLLPADLSPVHDPWLAALFGHARNVVVTPLFAEGGCLGVIAFEHGERQGSRIERRLLTIIERFASHTALALRNAMLLKKVQEAASTDALTGIANRRSFEEALEREIARSVRTGEPVSLVMLDLDHFKQLNDTYGHQTGDDVLREVAQALMANCREMDLPARYGGEEFTVILPNCDVDEVQSIAPRLWAGVSEAPRSVPVTVSAGYATFPDNATTGRGLLGAADQALYEAKHAGRNRLVGCAHTLPQTQLGVVVAGGG